MRFIVESTYCASLYSKTPLSAEYWTAYTQQLNYDLGSKNT